jgi:hypothetical protein
MIMRAEKASAPVQKPGTELLGFKRDGQADRPARIRRSVRAKVGPKPSPPSSQSTG